MFDFFTKFNIIMTFFKLLKEQKFVRISFFILCLITFLFFYAIYQFTDNSIYADSEDDALIKNNMKKILVKCGDKNAMGVSTVSTINQIEHNAKFKEIFSCDYSLNSENCLVDLSTDKFPFAGDYLLDQESYKFISELATKEDVVKIYLPEFDMDQFSTIKELLTKSTHFSNGEAKYLFLTAVENHEKKLIYIIHLFSWSNNNCTDVKYFLDKFRKKLPKNK